MLRVSSADLIHTIYTHARALAAAVWRRCVPTEAQRLARLAEAEFTSRQLDAFEDQYEAWDPDGGLADGEMLEASWDDEAWDDPDA